MDTSYKGACSGQESSMSMQHLQPLISPLERSRSTDPRPDQRRYPSREFRVYHAHRPMFPVSSNAYHHKVGTYRFVHDAQTQSLHRVYFNRLFKQLREVFDRFLQITASSF